jgi:hypothetical protein
MAFSLPSRGPRNAADCQRPCDVRAGRGVVFYITVFPARFERDVYAEHSRSDRRIPRAIVYAHPWTRARARAHTHVGARLGSIPSEIPVSADGDVNETCISRDKAPPNVPTPLGCAQEAPDVSGTRIRRVHRILNRILRPRLRRSRRRKSEEFRRFRPGLFGLSREKRERERERERDMLTGSVRSTGIKYRQQWNYA